MASLFKERAPNDKIEYDSRVGLAQGYEVAMDYSWQHKANEMNAAAANEKARNEAAAATRAALHAEFIRNVIGPFLAAMKRAGNPGLIKCLDQTYDMTGWRCRCGLLGRHKPGWNHPDPGLIRFVKIYLDGRFYFYGSEKWLIDNEKLQVDYNDDIAIAFGTAQRWLIDILQANNVPMPQ